MPRRRNDYDPLADRMHAHWLEIRDAQGLVLECTAVDVGADLRTVMVATIARLMSDGWQIEGDGMRGSFFCARGSVRCLVQLRPTDPESATFGPSRFG